MSLGVEKLLIHYKGYYVANVSFKRQKLLMRYNEDDVLLTALEEQENNYSRTIRVLQNDVVIQITVQK